jgi:hypothetical protein
VSKNLNEPAYKIGWDLERFYGTGFHHDLDLIQFPTASKLRTIIYDMAPTELPKVLFFNDLNGAFDKTDFPYSVQSLPILSAQAFSTLCDVDDFPHATVPIVVVRKEPFESDQAFYDNPEAFKSRILRDDLFLVRLEPRVDLFDWGASKYRRSPIFQEHVDRVEEYVFDASKAPLPPIFRVAPDKVALFASSQARASLRKAGIRGIQYESLKRTKPHLDQPEIDVPVDSL